MFTKLFIINNLVKLRFKMKNSFLRRRFFELRVTIKDLIWGVKNPESFKRKNNLSPIMGRFSSYKFEQLSGIQSNDYVSDCFYFNKIEAKINNFELSDYFNHKGYLPSILQSNAIPLLFNYISGIVYDAEDKVIDANIVAERLRNDPNNTEFVIKRSVGTGGGESVEIGSANEIIPFFNLYAKKKYDFVIQPLIKQHDLLAAFNPSSLNTVRIMTLAYDNNVHHVSSMVKMGGPGGRIDNVSAGGLCIGIKDDGSLTTFGFDCYLNKTTRHPQTQLSFPDNYEIPYFNEMVEVVKDKHKLFKSHGIISWDVSVDNDGYVTIVECNTAWSGLESHQAFHGPVFKRHMEYIKNIN
ncbi:sugar-transfer associated ATP-grasp domain-containing protein [Photobacterium piscicola]|uniref:sugar-transfer associated ATP-grasp domain-containing protein n=1 Tax=Photobacterium piscicola TaxID=1378299 RepID=UPI0038D1ABDD